MTCPLSRRDLWRAALLALVAALVWLYPSSMWRISAWHSPLTYEIDGLETLARMRAIGEIGPSVFVDQTVERLGAPFGADWSKYPMPDVPVFLLFAAVAEVVGVVTAAHLALLFAPLMAVLVFFFCGRALGHRPVFAAGTALLFGFSHFVQFRSLGHYSLALAFVVPAIVLTAWLVGASTAMLQRRGWQAFCLATAAVTGTGNPYFGLALVVLLSCALAYQALTGRRRQNLVTGATSLFVFAVTLVVCHAAPLKAMFTDHGVIVRDYASVDALAMRPIELLIPAQHHPVPPVAQLAKTYALLSGKGELFGPYLGVVGLLGVVLVALLCIRARRRSVLRPAHGPMLLLILLCAMSGGLGNLIALSVTDLFRAGNRYSVFILAVVLMALGAWATRRWRTAPTVGAWIVAGVVVGFGIWEQSLPPLSREQLIARRTPVQLDQRMGEELERQLAPGSMVFQLPVVPFLEQRAVGRMKDYEQLRPFLFTETLRFSYGHLATAPPLAWMRRVSKLPAARMVAELEAAGFAAIHLHRAAYADGGDALVRELEQAGAQPLFDEAPHRILRLRPSSAPVRPVLRGPNRYEPWDNVYRDDASVTLLAAEGFHHFEADEKSRWRWAGNRATAVIWNPTGTARPVRLRCSCRSLSGGHLWLRVQGRELWSGHVPIQLSTGELELEAGPGETRLEWEFKGRLMRASRSDLRLLGFALQDVSIE